MSSNRPVSACLLSWKRPQNLQLILDSLHHHNFIDEILVWNNNTEVNLVLRGNKVRVIKSHQNTGCYGRFLCAREARNDTIYVQDDDVIVKNVPELYQGFMADSSCITYGLNTRHFRQLGRNVYADGHVALIGWGAFFRKEWIAILNVYVEAYGVDALMRREADKFFSILLGKRHNVLLAEIQQLSDARMPGISLHREEQHRLMKALAVRHALELLRRSKSIQFPVTWNVVIPCYNYGKYLHDSVNSVLLNDADYVITIVDDASTDDTSEVAKRFSHKYSHISYLRHDQNYGVSRTRNRGIAAVDSLFVVLLDADDRIGPDFLFSAEKLLGSGCDVANPDAILFGDKSTRWRVPEIVLLPMLLERNYVHYSAAFRRCYWVQVGGFDESMGNWQDYEFWIRVAKAGARIARLPGNHFYHRKHGPSKSSHSVQISDKLRSYIRQKHRDVYS